MSRLIGLRKEDDEQKVMMMNAQPTRENTEVTLSVVWILSSCSFVQAMMVGIQWEANRVECTEYQYPLKTGTPNFYIEYMVSD